MEEKRDSTEIKESTTGTISNRRRSRRPLGGFFDANNHGHDESARFIEISLKHDQLLQPIQDSNQIKK